MADWTTIPDTSLETGKPIRGVDTRALRDNPVAIAQMAPGAPVARAGWHPYDMVAIGDGATGKFYDFAVQGAVSAIETPDFEDGYEYAIFWDRVAHTTNLGSRTVVLSLYKSVDAAYQTAYTSTATVNDDQHTSGWVEIVAPRLNKTVHGVRGFGVFNTTVEQINTAIFDATLQKIGKARLQITTESTSTGAVYLYRRGMAG